MISRNLLNYFKKKVTKEKRQLNPDGIFRLSNFPFGYVFLITKYRLNL